MIEASYEGHYAGCQYIGIDNEITHFESLLSEAIKDENLLYKP